MEEAQEHPIIMCLNLEQVYELEIQIDETRSGHSPESAIVSKADAMANFGVKTAKM